MTAIAIAPLSTVGFCPPGPSLTLTLGLGCRRLGTLTLPNPKPNPNPNPSQVPCRFANLGVLRKQECERVQVRGHVG